MAAAASLNSKISAPGTPNMAHSGKAVYSMDKAKANTLKPPLIASANWLSCAKTCKATPAMEVQHDALPTLKVLADNRHALLLAEVAAWLHEVGKFTDLHIEHHAINPSRKWSNDDAYKAVIDTPTSVIKLSRAAANIKKPDIINNVLNATSPKAADYLPDDLKQNLQSLHVNLLKQDYSLAELIMLGMPGFATHQNRTQLLDSKDGWLPACWVSVITKLTWIRRSRLMVSNLYRMFWQAVPLDMSAELLSLATHRKA